jgi:DNA-binding NarL/FixJ family response regulator
MNPADTTGAIARRRTLVKKVVVVADNPLIVAAIRAGVRDSGALELVGYVDPRGATAVRIANAGADVVLIDEGDRSQLTIELVRELRARNEDIYTIVLPTALEGDWLAQALHAGAHGAISKTVHPTALATLVREAMRGHIFHAPPKRRSADTAPTATAHHSSLTDRELQILRLVASGTTNGAIAAHLWITQQTVKFHVSNIYRKLGVSNRTEACHYAHVNGIGAKSDSGATGSDQVHAIAS